jgi:cytochrome c
MTPARKAGGCPRSGSFPDLGGYATRIAIGLSIALALIIVLSTIHPWGNLRASAPTPALLDGSNVPPHVRQVLEQKCADCHSENTHWPGYSRVAPASWLIERDVHDGRSHLNLSQWQHYSVEDQATLLNRIAAEVRSGQMPVKRYLVLHPQARLSPDEQQLVYDWAKAERKQIRKQLAVK